MPIVSNSSPLIALEQIHQLELLQLLFGEILIPDRVGAETVSSVRPHPWIRQQSLSRPLLPATLRPALGSGERDRRSQAMLGRLDRKPILLGPHRVRTDPKQGWGTMTDKRKRVAAVFSLNKSRGKSERLSVNPKFMKIIEKARKDFARGKKQSLEDVEKELLG